MTFTCAIENQRACLSNRRLRRADADVETKNVVSVWGDSELFDFQIGEMKQTFDFRVVGDRYMLPADDLIKRSDDPVVALDDGTMSVDGLEARFKLDTDWRG
jgi:hypothetical protein